jgi:hypothetical protein
MLLLIAHVLLLTAHRSLLVAHKIASLSDHSLCYTLYVRSLSINDIIFELHMAFGFQKSTYYEDCHYLVLFAHSFEEGQWGNENETIEIPTYRPKTVTKKTQIVTHWSQTLQELGLL